MLLAHGPSKGLCPGLSFRLFTHSSGAFGFPHAICLFSFGKNLWKHLTAKKFLENDFFITWWTWFLDALPLTICSLVFFWLCVDDTWSRESSDTASEAHHNVFWQRESLFPHNVNKKNTTQSSDDVRFAVAAVVLLFECFFMSSRARREEGKLFFMILISGETRTKKSSAASASTIRTSWSGNNWIENYKALEMISPFRVQSGEISMMGS